MIIAVKHIPFVSAPGVVGTDKFIDSVPCLLIFGCGCHMLGRVSHHLPPEKTRQLWGFGSGHVAVGDEKVRIAIMIKVPRVRAPGPTPELKIRVSRGIAEFSVSQILVEGISPRVAPVQGAGLSWVSRMKGWLF